MHVLSYLVLKQAYIAQMSKIAGAFMKFNYYNKFQQIRNNPDDIRTISRGADFGLFYCCFLEKKAHVLFLVKKTQKSETVFLKKAVVLLS